MLGTLQINPATPQQLPLNFSVGGFIVKLAFSIVMIVEVTSVLVIKKKLEQKGKRNKDDLHIKSTLHAMLPQFCRLLTTHTI